MECLSLLSVANRKFHALKPNLNTKPCAFSCASYELGDLFSGQRHLAINELLCGLIHLHFLPRNHDGQAARCRARHQDMDGSVEGVVRGADEALIEVVAHWECGFLRGGTDIYARADRRPSTAIEIDLLAKLIQIIVKLQQPLLDTDHLDVSFVRELDVGLSTANHERDALGGLQPDVFSRFDEH